MYDLKQYKVQEGKQKMSILAETLHLFHVEVELTLGGLDGTWDRHLPRIVWPSGFLHFQFD